MWVLSVQMQPDEEGKTKYNRCTVRGLLDTGKQCCTTRKNSGRVRALLLHQPSVSGQRLRGTRSRCEGIKMKQGLLRLPWELVELLPKPVVQARFVWSLATPAPAAICGFHVDRCARVFRAETSLTADPGTPWLRLQTPGS